MNRTLFSAYLRRLGLGGPPPPHLASLADLMGRHLQTVPFENLDVVERKPRPLNTEMVLRKVTVESRGGFCYELNETFRALLDHLGFEVRRIEARVWQAAAQRFGAPFDHLALVVSLPQGEFLVDVGFGDNNRTPMQIPQDHTRDVSGEYHLSPVESSPSVQDSAAMMSGGRLCLRSATQPLYEMTLDAQPLEAFATMCRYHQTSPESIFSKGLICTRATPSGRVTLSRDRLIIVENGRRTDTVITDVAGLLERHFAIRSAASQIPHTPKDTMASC
jgi:N-hydroxyarylamine O-acetyltransferase